MAWTQKDTRRIIVAGQKFLWHLPGNRLDGKDVMLTVGKDKDRYFLFIDPYAWDFELTPKNITEAFKWALQQGWTTEKGPSRYMAWSSADSGFVWLPKGISFIHELKQT